MVLSVVGVGITRVFKTSKANDEAIIVNFSLNPGSAPSPIAIRYHLPIGILFSISRLVYQLTV